MDKSFSNIFKNKTIFLTGHTGFIGSWLALWLIKLSSNVIGYSLKSPSNPAMFEILGIKKEITHIHGDINNQELLEKKILEHKPNFLFHLAAQSLVRESYLNTKKTFQTNVMGTVNVLEAVRNSRSIKNVIVMTSDKSYDNQEKFKFYKEDDSLGGSDPYSASKGSAEIIINSYRKSFFQDNKKHDQVALSTIRAGNVIGGGDWSKDRIVPDCIRALKSKIPIKVRSPNSIRPFQFVLEPISALLWISANMKKDPKLFSTSWNVGPTKKFGKTQIKTLVPKIIKEWGSGTWIYKADKVQKIHHESNTLMLDSTKIKRLLKWSPIFSVNDAIKYTTNWYKRYYERSDNMQDFTLEQIDNYIKKAKEMNMQWTKCQ